MTREEFLNLKEGDDCIVINNDFNPFHKNSVVKFQCHYYMNNEYGRFADSFETFLLKSFEVEKIKDHE